MVSLMPGIISEFCCPIFLAENRISVAAPDCILVTGGEHLGGDAPPGL